VPAACIALPAHETSSLSSASPPTPTLAGAISSTHARLPEGHGQLRLSITPNRRPGVFRFRNLDLSGEYDRHAQDGRQLTLSASAIYLATHKIEAALESLQRAAAEFGVVDDVPRCVRVDLAADFTGFPLDDLDATNFVLKGAKLRRYSEYDRRGRHSGWTAGTGAIRGALYDKTLELRLPTQRRKREIEQARWRRAGWNEGTPVTRVEFRYRGQFLRQVGIRDPHELVERLGGLWRYSVDRWMRLVTKPKDGWQGGRPRSRSLSVHPRWLAVQAVSFEGDQLPVTRSCPASGPDIVVVVSFVRSCIAAAGRLSDVALPSVWTGQTLAEYLRGLCMSLARQGSIELIRRYGCELSGERLRARHEAESRGSRAARRRRQRQAVTRRGNVGDVWRRRLRMLRVDPGVSASRCARTLHFRWLAAPA
jgi:hypothetical protein